MIDNKWLKFRGWLRRQFLSKSRKRLSLEQHILIILICDRLRDFLLHTDNFINAAEVKHMTGFGKSEYLIHDLHGTDFLGYQLLFMLFKSDEELEMTPEKREEIVDMLYESSFEIRMLLEKINTKLRLTPVKTNADQSRFLGLPESASIRKASMLLRPRHGKEIFGLNLIHTQPIAAM